MHRLLLLRLLYLLLLLLVERRSFRSLLVEAILRCLLVFRSLPVALMLCGRLLVVHLLGYRVMLSPGVYGASAACLSSTVQALEPIADRITVIVQIVFIAQQRCNSLWLVVSSKLSG